MTTKCKWNDAIFLNTDEEILNHYNKKNNCLYIMGKGFDPRMVASLNLLSKTNSTYDILLIDFSGGKQYATTEQKKLTEDNIKKLNAINKNYRTLKIPSDSVLSVFLKQNLMIPKKCNRVVVDISSMPQSVSFNIIKQIRHNIEAERGGYEVVKIDIITCENSSLDDAICPTDLESANYLVGFNTFSGDLESDHNRVSVWFPLLGMTCGPELDRLKSLIEPDEICPILPFPSENPRRSEEIFLELGDTLFSELGVDRRNVLYVAEQNVLDIYKKLHNAIEHYNRVFKEIGEPRFYVSLGSSKLIGLGALLVHLERSESGLSETGISFAHVSNNGYRIDMNRYDQSLNRICVFCLEDNLYEW